ncbi:MAG: hypothetical protein AAB360_00885 [Patescibacteria group bacterium]
MKIIESSRAATSAGDAVSDLSGGTAFATGTDNIAGLITGIVNILLMIASALAVLYLIYSGILYITAAGNPDNAKKGQQGVVNAIIGIAVIVLSYAIVRAVRGTLLKL